MNRKKIALNDWVTSQSKVGKIVSEGEKGEFWVLWSGDSLPLNESAKSLDLANYDGEDLAGKTFKDGRCNRLIYEYGVKAEVYFEHKKKPQIWSLEKLNQELESEKSSSANPSSSEKTFIPLNKIRRDGGTQPRANINHQTVLEYVEDMKKGDSFPPVVVYYDGTDFWLCDGFHRFEAAFGVGLKEIAAVVKQGTRRDAVLYSVGANAKHGLRRTNADKRRAVMRLLEDEEWSRWSDPAGICFAVRKIAKITSTSHPLVAKIRSGLTGNFSSDNLNSDSSNLTGNFSSDNPSERTYITKHGTQAKMNTANIGKGKQTDSSPTFDEVVIPDSEQIEQINEDKEVSSPSFEENNHSDDEFIDSAKPKRSKGKQKLINPLSIGDKVKVKDNHYFGGQVGIVTQLTTPYSVIVAFDNGERDVINLTDLDLPSSQTKPITVTQSKPVKKEILIKDGLNYKAGNPGYGCKWYIEVEEEDYQLFQQLQKENNAPSIRSCLVRLAQEKKEEELPPPSDDILINLSSKVVHLNKQQKLFLAQKLMESDSELLSQLIILLQGEEKRGT